MTSRPHFEFNGESDHVHLLAHFPSKVAVSKLVNSLKGVSSRRLRQESPELERRYWTERPYRAAVVGLVPRRQRRGAPLGAVRQYIEGQQQPSWARGPSSAGPRAGNRPELTTDLKTGAPSGKPVAEAVGHWPRACCGSIAVAGVFTVTPGGGRARLGSAAVTRGLRCRRPG